MTLVGYWPLNEENGDTAYDYSGNENHGGLEGNPTQGANGVVGGNAYEFDGDDDYVETIFQPDSDNDVWSLSFWVYVNEPHEWAVGHFAEDTRIYISNAHGWRLGDGRVEGDGDFLRENDFSVGEWSHLVLVGDGSMSRAYVNGDFVGEDSYSWSGSTNNLLLGAINSDSPDDFLDGVIDDVRIYNRALTPAEIQYLYNVSRRGRFVSRKKQP